VLQDHFATERDLSRQGQRARDRERARGLVGAGVPRLQGQISYYSVCTAVQHQHPARARVHKTSASMAANPRCRALLVQPCTGSLPALALDRVAVAHGTRLARTQGAWRAWCRYADTWQSCCSLRDDVTIASTGVMNVSSFPGWFPDLSFLPVWCESGLSIHTLISFLGVLQPLEVTPSIPNVLTFLDSIAFTFNLDITYI
jgi:hypothetical protein